MAQNPDSLDKQIQQQDPLSIQRPYLDFQFLRSEGLKHLGELSGKIWTDHNAHDPGITILEVLCYALLDLGHRTTLPIQDLLSSEQQPPDFSADDNFFTPLEILSCNPVTILDFRKLLLEIKGVRNAWLTPAEQQEMPLYVDIYHEGATLQCTRPEDYSCTSGRKRPAQCPPYEVHLNGLYDVFLELEPWTGPTNAEQEKAYICDILEQARDLLSRHRNLCEDFRSITILAPCNIGICANIQLEANASAAQVYAQVLQKVQQYISPGINYYTLPQLLDKGRSMEEIFAGRPFSTESFGFVDTEELLLLPLKKALYLSDLYQLILKVKGVVSVRSLALTTSGGQHHRALGPFKIPEGYVARFDLSLSCFELNNGRLSIDFDKKEVEKRFQNLTKTQLGRNSLDFPIPKGTYYSDLGDYYSIQNDFPKVYGIGPGGLSDDEPLLRKVQAQQLKGYLLFFDQILINYLNQLKHLRQLFSLKQESLRSEADLHTYFTQELLQVPGVERLLQHRTAGSMREGTTLAVAVVHNEALSSQLAMLKDQPNKPLLLETSCEPVLNGASRLADPSASRLNVRIEQSVHNFISGDYTIEIHQDLQGYFFLICFTQYPDWVLVGYQRYKSATEAQEAANFAAFLATQHNNYEKSVRQNDHQTLDFGFELQYHPMAYQDYLQYLLEDEDRYCSRRSAFLDHLLARFSTQFTDYAVLRYGTVDLQKKERRQVIEDKSRMLSHIDHIGRNRGRAFDYLQPSWGTENISGFEQRIAMMAGMKDWRRRKLCKFEVVPSFQYILSDLLGPALCKEISGYPDAQSLSAMVKKLMLQLRNPGQYPSLRLKYPRLDETLIRQRFSVVPGPENIVPGSYYYHLQLTNATDPDTAIQKSEKQDFNTEKQALAHIKAFLGEIKTGPDKHLRLTGAGQSASLYFDQARLRFEILPYHTFKWRAAATIPGSTDTLSEQVFDTSDAAWEDLAGVHLHAAFLTQHTEVFEWEMYPANGLHLMSSLAYRNRTEAERAWLRCKALGENPEHYHLVQSNTGERWLQLKTGQGTLLAVTPLPEGAKVQASIRACCAAFAAKKDKISFQLSENTHYGFLLLDSEGKALMESLALYQLPEAALQALNEAHTAASGDKNYLDAGSEENPEYRKLLRGLDEQLIACTLPPYESNAKKRDAVFKSIKKDLKALQPLFYIDEQPLRYTWNLILAENQDVVLQSETSFETLDKAQDDFENAMTFVWKLGEGPVALHLYSISTARVIAQYRYRYALSTEGNYLESEKEYTEKKDAENDYGDFILALPELTQQGERFTAQLNDKEIAVTASGKNAVEDAKQRVQEMRGYYIDAEIEQKIIEKWVYRMVDIEHPQAVSAQPFSDCQTAQNALQSYCEFQPYSYDPKKIWIQVVCPPQDPGKFHAAICIVDEQGVPHTILHSYQGYDSWEAAVSAGELQGLQWIELAADAANYGTSKPISTAEIYAPAPDPCLVQAPYVVVLPQQFADTQGSIANAIATAVSLAKRFPFRVRTKTDSNGKETERHYYFQGYDLIQDKILWVSAIEYPEFKTCAEAYLLFVVLLTNPNSCRVHCEPHADCEQTGENAGNEMNSDCDCLKLNSDKTKCIVKPRYLIHLTEILAQSDPFDSLATAWGELAPAPTREDCENMTGVRKFTQAAVSNLGFIQISKDDCYHFIVVSDQYLVADHTCSYFDAEARNNAIQLVLEWANKMPVTPEFEVRLIQNDKKWQFVLVNTANEAALQKEKTVCGCEEKSAPPAPPQEICEMPVFMESTLIFDTHAAASAYLPRFLDLLKDAENYQITQESGVGPFGFKIVDRQEILAAYPYQFADKEFSVQAEDRTKAHVEDDGMHLLEHILLRPTKAENCNCLLPVWPEKECMLLWEEELDDEDPCTPADQNNFRYIPGADPYSFWATVVLPGWHRRFRTQAGRDAFMHLLHTEAPALVALNIVWLSPKQMCEFETTYQRWLNQRLYPGFNCGCPVPESDPYCDLVNKLKDIYNLPICADDQTDTPAPCDCGAEPARESKCLVNPDRLFWWDKPEPSRNNGGNQEPLT